MSPSAEALTSADGTSIGFDGVGDALGVRHTDRRHAMSRGFIVDEAGLTSWGTRSFLPHITAGDVPTTSTREND